jgi:hypothetical protein
MADSRNAMLQNQFAQLQAKPKTNQNMAQQLMPNQDTADMDGVSPYALANPASVMPQMMPTMPQRNPAPVPNPPMSMNPRPMGQPNQPNQMKQMYPGMFGMGQRRGY